MKMHCSRSCQIMVCTVMRNIHTCLSCNYNMLMTLGVIAGEEVVTALGSEVDRLEKEIQELVPGIRHVDIEAHNPTGPSP
jgi:hypothetical protein